MIEAVLFDLDGVLVSTVRLHAHAFKSALKYVVPGFALTPAHEAALNGLSTREKLSRLSAEGVPLSHHQRVWSEKQRITSELIPRCIPHDPLRASMVGTLRSIGLKVGCVSNAIKPTTYQMLACAGFSGAFDVVLSNEDVPRQKPAPDPYLLAMERLQVRPRETLVVEDAPHGVESARRAGAHVLVLDSFESISLDRVMRAVSEACGDGRRR